MWRRFSLIAVAAMLAATVALAEEARTGAWVDEITLIAEPDPSKAVTMVEVGELDVFAFTVTDPELFNKIMASPVMRSDKRSYGVFTELTFNPYGPTFEDGRLNPFSVPAIREAMNWLIDRDYLCAEIYGGLAIPRYFAITPVFPDYAKLIDVARELELHYAYNPDKAKAVITEEMEKLGAEFVDGKWYYQGKPVEITFLIRLEDERKQMGDYVAAKLEDLGFVVKRQYGISRELAPCWAATDPAKGCFHIYTAGWISTAIDRDQGGDFDFFYTTRGLPIPLTMAYKPAPEFDEASEKLARRDYTTLEERRELMEKVLRLSMKDSVRVWLTNEAPIFALRKEIDVAHDLSGGISASSLWPYTIRRVDEVGGRIKIGNTDLFVEPWNPIAGTSWVYDLMPIDATRDMDCLSDPYTGLPLPQRIDRAEVYVEEGLPVTRTLDWVDLNFVPKIEVPADAWIDWDPAAQKFITVGEKYPEGLTAKTKTVVYYPADFFQAKWHDGSTMSMGDLMMNFILLFDRAKEESAIFDEAEVPDFETFQKYFRGLRIVQQKPLVTEWYSDLIYLDAEYIADAAVLYPTDPDYSRPTPWHTVAIGVMAEANKELVFSSDKADKLGVEWMNFVAGPSLAILEKYLDQAIATGYIPYAPTMGDYITTEEALARYQALKTWYQEKGHFWVGNGPFYLESVEPVAKILVLKRFPEFPDPAEKWLRFAEPRIAEVEVSGPPLVEIGTGADFLVDVTFKGELYPTADIEFVKYLVFDAAGELAFVGEAQAVADGLWVVSLTPEQTAKLVEGASRLEVVVSPKVVSIPSFKSLEFLAL